MSASRAIPLYLGVLATVSAAVAPLSPGSAWATLPAPPPRATLDTTEAPDQESGRALSSADLQNALTAYVDGGVVRGAAAARITPGGVETAFAGSVGGFGGTRPDGSTLFEIGSITKVFTGVLLADMVIRGEVSLEDTVGELLPDRRFDPDVASITLRELATHTSGLPRLPLEVSSFLRLLSRPSDPYRGTPVDEVLGALQNLDGSRLGPRGEPGYSNLGPAVLGAVLASVADRPYPELLRDRVLRPLGMNATRLTRKTLEDPARARGHRQNLRPTSSWLLDGYDPAGGLSSSLDDMAKFLESALTAERGALARSMDPAWADPEEGLAAALGWALGAVDGELLVWHNGRTGGFYAFVGLMPGQGRALVLLTNTGHSGDAFAVRLLRGEPMGDPRPRRPSGFLVALTGVLVAAAPLGLWRAGRRIRRTSEAGATAPSKGRLHLLEAGLEAALLLTVAWKIGAWAVVPGWWWTLGFGAALGFAAAGLASARDLPWWPASTRPGRASLSVLMGVTLAALWWAVFRL